MHKAIGLIIAVSMVFVAALVIAHQDTGAEQITLDGGSRGSVSFPHREHQEVLKDCLLCHDLFPKEAGVIAKLKSSGDLKKKQVMNDKCLDCHRAKKAAGLEAGPVSCSECHTR